MKTMERARKEKVGDFFLNITGVLTLIACFFIIADDDTLFKYIFEHQFGGHSFCEDDMLLIKVFFKWGINCGAIAGLSAAWSMLLAFRFSVKKGCSLTGKLFALSRKKERKNNEKKGKRRVKP